MCLSVCDTGVGGGPPPSDFIRGEGSGCLSVSPFGNSHTEVRTMNEGIRKRNLRNNNGGLTATKNNGPNWGPHPPRRTQRATALWVWMIMQGTYLSFTEIKAYANGRWSYGFTPNQLQNLLCKYPKAFKQGEMVRVGNCIGTYEVRTWKAIL